MEYMNVECNVRICNMGEIVSMRKDKEGHREDGCGAAAATKKCAWPRGERGKNRAKTGAAAAAAGAKPHWRYGGYIHRGLHGCASGGDRGPPVP